MVGVGAWVIEKRHTAFDLVFNPGAFRLCRLAGVREVWQRGPCEGNSQDPQP